MRRQPRKFGKAIGPILDPATDELVGWVYEWDNGERSRLLLADLPPPAPDAGPTAGAQVEPPP